MATQLRDGVLVRDGALVGSVVDHRVVGVGDGDDPGTERDLAADLVLLAMGFVGPEPRGLVEELGLRLTDRGNVWRDANWMTSEPGVFTAGDMQRGQSLIVWAIADGRQAASAVDAYLMQETALSATA